jgi:5-methylcytosine-specific restriction endonuclease McrA
MVDLNASCEVGVVVDVATAPTKRCPGCDTEKARESFHKNRAQPSGLASECKACSSARRKRKQLEDPEYVAKNRARAKRFYDANREERIEKAHAYYHSAPQELKDEWKRRQNERRRQQDRREEWQRRHARKMAATVEEVDFAIVLERDAGICYLCEAPISGTPHFDHIIALCQGGEHSYANIAATHPFCNMSKNGKSLDQLSPEWRDRAERKLSQIQLQGETT